MNSSPFSSSGYEPMGKHARISSDAVGNSEVAFSELPSLEKSASDRFKPVHRRRNHFAGKALAGVVALTLLAGSASALTLVGCSQDGDANAAETSATETNDANESAATGADSVDTSLMDLDYSDRDLDGSYDEAEAVSISLSDSGSTAQAGSNLEDNATDAVTIDGSSITITDEGIYILSGDLSDGQIAVAAEDTDKVQIVLDNATINNDDGPAINVTTADKVFITLADGSSNTLSDGDTYALEDGSDEPNATIFSKSDLTINGNGSLTVDANYMHGISSKDELKITGGAIDVDAVEDGIRGRDSLMIYDGTITVTAGDDGLKSNNDEDVSRGFIAIDGGDVTINAADKGANAETALLVRGGNVTIESCEEGYQATLVQIEDGVTNITANDDGINASAGTLFETSTSSNATNSTDADAVNDKPADMTDDSDTSADSATEQAPDASTMPEDMQGQAPSDMQGEPPADMQGDPSGNMQREAPSDMQGQTPPDMAEQEDSNQKMPQDGTFGDMGGGEQRIAACQLVITGGVVVVDAEGDALDSNGDISVSGGTVLANGSSGDVEVAMDYNGTSTITGGTVILAGASGMAQSFSDEKQPFGMVQVSGSAGQTITLADEDGNVIASMTATNDFATVVVSSSELSTDTTYQVVIDGELSGSATDDNGLTSGGTVEGGSSTTFTASTEGSSPMGGMQGGKSGEMREDPFQTDENSSQTDESA